MTKKNDTTTSADSLRKLGDYGYSAEREAKSEDRFIKDTGAGTSRQGRALWKYRDQLDQLIAADRRRPQHNIDIWRQLKDIDDLALLLLTAGVTAAMSKEVGVDDDGDKNCRDMAIWIGRSLIGYRSDDHLLLKVGAWGIDRLTGLPFFALNPDDVLVLLPTSEVNELMDDALDRAIGANPFIMPLDTKPEPWAGVMQGGLPVGHWASVALVNRHTSEPAWQRAIKKGSMWMALDAVNALQDTPFTINKPVFDVAQKMRPAVPPMPKWLAEQAEDVSHWRVKRYASKWYKAKLEAESWDLDMAMAEMVPDRFYVPLNMDFRGRIYAIPFFNFQRGDHVRGLFYFADGEPIGKEGALWLRSHVAGCADGNDWSDVKKPSRLNREQRVAWTNDNINRLRAIGEAVRRREVPELPNTLDDPVQLMAACHELVQAIDIGTSFVTRLPLTFDGSCNGLQHLCAMTRSPEAEMVNLAPNEIPEDFYAHVASLVYRGSAECAAIMQGPDDRAITKQPCSTYFYGATIGGMTDQISKVLKDRRPFESKLVKGDYKNAGMVAANEEASKQWYRALRKDATLLARAIKKTVANQVPLAEQVRVFLVKLVGLYNKSNRHMSWTTPTGIPVLNLYTEKEIKRIAVPLNGRRKYFEMAYDTDDLRKNKAGTSVTANFVHSLDATHLQMVAYMASQEDTASQKGITMTAVHDSFACLAPHAARFNEIILDRLTALYGRFYVLRNIWISTARDLKIDPYGPNRIKMPAPPEWGDLDVNRIRQATNAFR